MRKIDTLRFGEIEIEEKNVISFQHGLPGFEQEKEFILLPLDDDSPYMFMQSANTPELAFLIALPFAFFPDYSVEIDDAIIKELSIADKEDLAIYNILTIPNGKIKDVTANLLAPVVINTKNNQGRQVILDKTSYKTKHRIFHGGEENASIDS